MRAKEFIVESTQPDFMQILSDFLPVAMEELGIDGLPPIKLRLKIDDTAQPTFGKYVDDEKIIYLAIEDRHPLDIIRTLAHELVHFKQGIEHRLDDKSGATGSPAENEAHEVAGIIMRNFNKKYPQNFNAVAVSVKEDLNELDVSKTLNFATKAHSKQKYGNKPYISHPKSVAATGKQFFGSKFGPDAIKVALLHDVVEDTPYKLEQLAKMGYKPEIVQAVQLLTKNKALSYADNIRAIIASGNRLAMMVKYADNYQNFTGDKTGWDPARAAHSQKKYMASLNLLGDKLGITKHLGEP
jgi:hypothetical protein